MMSKKIGIWLQQGASLIEVMVAVFILGAGLLGLGALQARSLMMNQSAYYRSIAADLAYDLADRIRANRSPYWSKSITSSGGVQSAASVPSDLPLSPNFGTCTAVVATMTCPQNTARQSYMVLSDMKGWAGNVSKLLPNGSYTLTTDPNTCISSPWPTSTTQVLCRYTLTLTWQDDRSVSGGANLSYVTVIE